MTTLSGRLRVFARALHLTADSIAAADRADILHAADLIEAMERQVSRCPLQTKLRADWHNKDKDEIHE